jgi:isopentenyldiphosphate isomerase
MKEAQNTSGDELVDLISPENQVIGQTPRREVRARNLLHRGVGILCRNAAQAIYVHRRTDTKDVFPSMYDMFVGGVVTAGESYAAAAKREIAEELGIVGPEPRLLFHHLYKGPLNHSWVAVYAVEWDGPIRHQESEVAWGQYLSMEDLLVRLETWSFVPDGLEIFHRYLQDGKQSGVSSNPASG